MQQQKRFFMGVLAVLAVCSSGGAQDSLGMRRIATLNYWQFIENMEIVGTMAYVACAGSGLRVLDLTNPSQLVEVACLDNWSAFVEISENRAYVTSGLGGVVLDIADPLHLQELGRWHIGGSYCAYYDILVHGNLGLVTDEERYTHVLDVSDPQDVHDIGVSFGPYIRAAGMAGNYVVLTGFEVYGGLRIYDFSDPQQPVRVAVSDTNCQTQDVVIAGDYAYLANWNRGLSIYNLSNPLQPVLVSTCDSGDGYCQNVSVTDNFALVTKPMDETTWRLDIWNVADPAHPFLESSNPSASCLGKPSGMGTHIYLPVYSDFATESRMAAAILDISNPTAPVAVGSLGDRAYLRRLTVRGTTAYIADLQNGLRITDVSIPSAPRDVGCSEPDSDIYGYTDVAVHGIYAYLVDGYQNLDVVNVSDSTHPQFVSQWHGGLHNYFCNIVVIGDYVYVNGDGCIYVFSLVNPAAPQRVDSLTIPDFGLARALSEWNGYLCAVGNGFWMYSLTNPAAPQLTGSIPPEPWPSTTGATDLSIESHYAYAAGGAALRVYDLSDPAQPVLVGEIPTTDCYSVAARRNYLIASETYGLRTWDISDPLNPEEVGYYTTVTEIENREEIQDITILDGHVLTTSNYRFRVYSCDALLGTTEYPKTIPHEYALHDAYPNPFNPTTTIGYDLAQAGQVTLVVYNLVGQHVATLVNGTMNAGRHSVVFDATVLPSGMYVCRIEAGGFSAMQKMVLLK